MYFEEIPKYQELFSISNTTIKVSKLSTQYEDHIEPKPTPVSPNIQENRANSTYRRRHEHTERKYKREYTFQHAHIDSRSSKVHTKVLSQHTEVLLYVDPGYGTTLAHGSLWHGIAEAHKYVAITHTTPNRVVASEKRKMVIFFYLHEYIFFTNS